MRTQPPCKTSDGKRCERRYIGCHADCEKWNEYLVAHEAEKEQMRHKKDMDRVADGFLIEQTDRVKQARRREYMREYYKRRG